MMKLLLNMLADLILEVWMNITITWKSLLYIIMLKSILKMTVEVRPFFTKRKRLDLLCPPPYTTIQRHLPTSNMAGRKYGYSMGNDKLKQIGEQYLYDWLGERRGIDEKTGLELTNIDFIPSKPLLEELISYNRKGNFDRVMALIGCIIRLEEIQILIRKIIKRSYGILI